MAARAVSHGVNRIRLTGGEPLLRRDLPGLVEMLAAVAGVEDLSLTTNGLLLDRHAGPLADAGLDRVTVSLDALDPGALRAISDAPLEPQTVLDGIDTAVAAGLAPVKVNMVVRRGLAWIGAEVEIEQGHGFTRAMKAGDYSNPTDR